MAGTQLPEQWSQHLSSGLHRLGPHAVAPASTGHTRPGHRPQYSGCPVHPPQHIWSRVHVSVPHMNPPSLIGCAASPEVPCPASWVFVPESVERSGCRQRPLSHASALPRALQSVSFAHSSSHTLFATSVAHGPGATQVAVEASSAQACVASQALVHAPQMHVSPRAQAAVHFSKKCVSSEGRSP